MSDTSKREPVQVGLSDLLGLLVFFLVPYGAIGFVWALAHTEHLNDLYGADNLFSFIGEIVAWPVLIFSDITLK